MTDGKPIDLQFGQQGLYIENEQDPASANNKGLTNAPDGSLKHAVNVDYQGTANLHRRKGYQDAWHRPENKTVELTLAVLTVEPTTGDVIHAAGSGAMMRVLSADATANTIRGIYLTVAQFNNAGEAIHTETGMFSMNPDPAAIAAGGVNNAIDTYDVHCIFQGAAGTNTGIFCDTDITWQGVRTQTRGIKGAGRYTYLDNRNDDDKSILGYDLERYTLFATRSINTAFGGRTLHFRNAATPNIKLLQAPVLDRTVFDALDDAGDFAFSDVNYESFNSARFWRYLTWGRGAENETYLLGTYGGHYYEPDTAPVAPPAWIVSAAATTQTPPTGSFDQTAVAGTPPRNWKCIANTCTQRRVLIWFPTWYEWWQSINPAYPQVPEVGLHNWFAPFIWYFSLEHSAGTDATDFYAEPCGMFLERYNESLFMARIERTELVIGAGTNDDTTRWVYEPSGFMWSFWGYATGMELGTPPVYPFTIPGEPRERVWGCAAPGFTLNRHNYFRRGDGLAITGLKTWNDSLYIMKPTGFGQINGTYSENMNLTDLQMTQGPCGPYAWCKADEGIYYCTKKGLYLFDGNPSSQNYCLSDGKVKKIFEEDIDWGSTTQHLTGDVLGLSMVWDKVNREVIISYPKRGEQGGGGANDLPAGTPTRMLVFDTQYQRFTEWDLRLPIDSDANQQAVAPGIMVAGQDPTDDDYLLLTHPIGNVLGNNDDGRLLFKGNEGYRDAVTIDGTATPEPLSGNRITYDATSKDHTFGTTTPKHAITRQRSIIYANNGGIKRKVIYNYYDELDETELTYTANEDGWWCDEPMVNCSTTTGTDALFAVVSFKYYHDDPLHIKTRITFNTGGGVMTATPPIASVLTQAITGATLTVTSVDLANHYVYGNDLATGTWDAVAGHTVTSAPAGILPTPCQPSAVTVVVNPENTNPDNEQIEWIATSIDVQMTEGDVG